MDALKLDIKGFCKKKCQRIAAYIHGQISNFKQAFSFRRIFPVPTSNMKEDVPNSEVLFLLPSMGIQFCQDNAILIAHQKIMATFYL